jgi:hypothetical protein
MSCRQITDLNVVEVAVRLALRQSPRFRVMWETLPECSAIEAANGELDRLNEEELSECGEDEAGGLRIARLSMGAFREENPISCCTQCR